MAELYVRPECLQLGESGRERYDEFYPKTRPIRTSTPVGSLTANS